MSHTNVRQGGFAHTMILIVVVLVLAVGGAGYYVFTQKDSKTDNKTASQTTSSKEVESACNKTLKDEDFCKFASNFNGLESYKTVMTTTGSGDNSVLTLEVENEQNSRMTTTEGGKETSAYISIGNDSYIKDVTDGSWTKYSSKPSDDSVSTDIKDSVKVEDFSTEEASKVEYKKIGKEACGKLTCFKYQIIDKENPGNEQFIWFDDKDYLMRRMTTKENGSTTDMTMSYEKVKISVPSPVKTSSSSSMPTEAEMQAALEAAQSYSQE